MYSMKIVGALITGLGVGIMGAGWLWVCFWFVDSEFLECRHQRTAFAFGANIVGLILWVIVAVSLWPIPKRANHGGA